MTQNIRSNSSFLNNQPNEGEQLIKLMLTIVCIPTINVQMETNILFTCAVNSVLSYDCTTYQRTVYRLSNYEYSLYFILVFIGCSFYIEPRRSSLKEISF